MYHLGFVLKMCHNQAFHFYKRIPQHQLLIGIKSKLRWQTSSLLFIPIEVEMAEE